MELLKSLKSVSHMTRFNYFFTMLLENDNQLTSLKCYILLQLSELQALPTFQSTSQQNTQIPNMTPHHDASFQ